MKYKCTICGYIYDDAAGRWEDLPEDWKCPVCGAPKSAFVPLEENVKKEEKKPVSSSPYASKPHEMSALELSMICSNLARGCEKQYMTKQMEEFRQLAAFFRAQEPPAEEADTEKLLALVEEDLHSGYPAARQAAEKQQDRGALRALTWNEKVTTIVQALLKQYEEKGDAMLENTNVWVCTVCGFIWIGKAPPEVCPVCKVPAWKFEKAEGGKTS